MKFSAIRPAWVVAGAVLLAGLVFAACTQHTWEDYWITFRASKHLADGDGLVYTTGERLHTFTSPLGTLLPAVLSWLAGDEADDFVLWTFRVMSTGALAAGVALLFRAMQALGARPVSCWLTSALIGLDAKIVDFSINGMETGLLVLFLALTIHGLLVAGPRQVVRVGVGWAGLMWSRPDSCVYIAVLGAGAVLFLAGATSGKSRAAWARLLFQAGLICTVLYIGWFLWAWHYYGSPVPHTIVAKAANKPPLRPLELLTTLVTYPFHPSSLNLIFLPPYSDHGGWPTPLVVANDFFAWLAILAWLLPGVRRPTRLVSLAFFLGNFYLTGVLRYAPPWYLPAVSLFGYLTIGLLFDQLFCLVAGQPSPSPAGRMVWLPAALRVAAGALAVGQAVLIVCVGRELQVQQELIENGLRRPIGLWLHEHARSPQDTVMLEPLGYIGYFSGLKMLDYPGLASKEMVEVRKRLGPDRENLAFLELKPDWIVLRPKELTRDVYTDQARLRKYYDPVLKFDASDKIKAVRWLPGRPYLQHDQTFLLFHRKEEPGPVPPT